MNLCGFFYLQCIWFLTEKNLKNTGKICYKQILNASFDVRLRISGHQLVILLAPSQISGSTSFMRPLHIFSNPTLRSLWQVALKWWTWDVLCKGDWQHCWLQKLPSYHWLILLKNLEIITVFDSVSHWSLKDLWNSVPVQCILQT